MSVINSVNDVYIPPSPRLVSSIAITRICVHWTTAAFQYWWFSTHLLLASSFATNKFSCSCRDEANQNSSQAFGRLPPRIREIQISSIGHPDLKYILASSVTTANATIGDVLFGKFYGFNEHYGSSSFSQNHALRLCSESPYFSSHPRILFIQHIF